MGIASTFQKFTFDKSIALCENQNQDKVENAFYTFNGKQWNCFFRDEKPFAQNDPYLETKYLPLICTKSSDTLQNGSIVYHREYENSSIKVSEINGRKFQYHTYSSQAFQIESKGTDTYYLRIQNCVPKNPWGEGYCGGCLWCEIQALVIKSAKDDTLYKNNFVDQLFELESKDSIYKGVFQSLEWSKPGKEVEVVVLLYPEPNTNPQKDSYLHHYIRKNKSKISITNSE
jgi:hypothetical protein